MRILIANHHLDQRAGSELYCLELATALHRLGVEVALFTFVSGEVAQQAARLGIPVYTPTEALEVERFQPTVLHVQHAPCLFYLATLRIRPATLFSSLGWLPSLEAAPPVYAGISMALAVSEEVQARLADTPMGQVLPIRVVRNWFNDLGLTPGPVRPPRPAERIAVVTNHLDETLRADLDALTSEQPGFAWQHLGTPTCSVDITPSLLLEFDRVITIGRTALLAGALGIPCLLYDMHGSDGLLRVEALDSLAANNFSGRTHRLRHGRAELHRLLFEDAEALDTGALSRAIWENYALSSRARELLALYEAVLKGPVRFDDEARRLYGAVGVAHAELVADLVKYRSSNSRAWEQLNALGSEMTRMRTYVAELERQLRSARAS